MGVKELLDLSGKVAIVTGGSRGLGLQLAEGLGEMGARVVLTARKQNELDAAQAALKAQGIEAATVAADISKPDAAAAICDAALAAFGTVDILVNNAGAIWLAPAEDTPDAGWSKMMEVNVGGAFRLCREVGKRVMIPRRSGKIVNIASIGGIRGTPLGVSNHTVAYSASKGAMVNFTRALATEWGPHNINVNCICPGNFRSAMSASYVDAQGTEMAALTPLRRIGNDQDFKGAAVYLASEASAYVTGQILAIDGGITVAYPAPA